MKPNRCGRHAPRRRRRSSPRRWRREGDLQLSEAYRTVVPFGMYCGGSLLCRTPVDFLAWLAETSGVEAKLKRLASELLAVKGVDVQRANWGGSTERERPAVQV
jgi:uncharacterized protein (DUF3820 family)